MQILETKLNFKPLTKRTKTDYIILHHCAGFGSVQSIHLQHINPPPQGNGWAGIGYHYYVRKNGEIWRGRPQWAQGSHCPGRNSDSISVCFEGNFEVEQMPEIQLQSGLWLVRYLSKQVYPSAHICGHREQYATACPGKNFPMAKFKAA